MPRTARAAVAGVCYHVINRGNAHATVFHSGADYERFIHLLRRATGRAPVSIFAYCLMPNHFHLVLRPEADSALATYMHWLSTSHVRAHHRRYGTDGRVWQGRFNAFPVQNDAYLLTVMRYVERNALRAALVARAEDWPWGSLAARRQGGRRGLLHPAPVSLPKNWLELVNAPQTAAEIEAVRHSIRRGSPFGSSEWVQQTASELGLEFTLRARGRPKK